VGQSIGAFDLQTVEGEKEEILKLENISKSYFSQKSILSARKEKAVLSGINLSLNKGEILGISGPSGSGKSTLARIIAMLDNPDSGRYLFKGEDTGGFTVQRLKVFRKECQIIFQDALEALSPHRTIQNVFEELSAIHKLGLTQSSMIELLAKVDLDASILDKVPYQMSGGQRQRIMIARAMILKPEVLICDEILSSVDQDNKQRILALLAEMRSDLKMSIIFISHDEKVLNSISDRILHLT